MKPITFHDATKQVFSLEVAERFFDSVVLFALFELDVFRLLAKGPQNLASLHSSVGGSGEGLGALLDAGVSLRILAKSEDAYTADERLLDCLGRADSPAYLGDWIPFLHAMTTPLFQLAEVVRKSVPACKALAEMEKDDTFARVMTRAMDSYARTRGIEMAQRLDLSEARSLLDIGCGPGTYSLAILERFPGIEATLLDLPGPIAEAQRIAEELGLKSRVRFVADDALAFASDRSYDLVLVSNTLHMLGPRRSRELLKRCYQLVADGGRLIVQAQYLNDDRTSPRWATLLNLIQHSVTEEGRNHTRSETARWMEEAGFAQIEYVPFSVWNVCSCLIGRRNGNGRHGLSQGNGD